jgi:hypothetical protein
MHRNSWILEEPRKFLDRLADCEVGGRLWRVVFVRDVLQLEKTGTLGRF